MAKKKVIEVSPDGESPDTVKNLAIDMAKYSRIPCLKEDAFVKLAEALKQLGVKFELHPVRSGQYKNGKDPFAYKAKMSSVSFIVDLS